MPKANTNEYDAVIIGAGISGLVCGCYLAKAGMKVLIAEQHFKPGGYCTSFKRHGFTFDAAAHSFGGLKFGNLRRIFADLEIDKKLSIQRFDPTDIIISPHYKVVFSSDLDKTINDLENTFPNEGESFRAFFRFLINPDPKSFIGMRSLTFKDLLDKYFSDNKLKAVLSFPLFGNSGLPPSLLSAFIGSKIFAEYLLDGGYVPKDGMQNLSNVLISIFKEAGGEIRVLCPVTKIKVKNNEIQGVIVKGKSFMPSRYVISNCDTRQTFFKLLDKSARFGDFSSRIRKMIPSLSTFIVYLGVDNNLKHFPEKRTNIWFLDNYDVDSMYFSAKRGDFNNIGGYLLHAVPEKRTILAYLNAPFKNEAYWVANKDRILQAFIKKIETSLVPELANHIIYKGVATPQTLYDFTLNYKGAAYGWASTTSQLAISDFKKPSFVNGLYLTGHWATEGIGIPGVSYLGFDTAKRILKKESLKKRA